jgi:hypothetical protein
VNKVDSHNSVAERPAPEASEVQTPGYFSIGDMEAGVNGTVVPAWWLNAVQDEILTVINNAEITPSKVDSAQLYAAIVHIISKNDFVVGANHTADEALNLAQTASSVAANGVALATAAQNTADDSTSAAAAAQNTADNALTTAESSLDLAQARYDKIDSVVDANTMIYSIRYYLTNTGCLNFPTELIFPVFFKVNITRNGEAASQSVWDSTGSRVYSRVATINFSEPENPIIEWTPWNSIAVPEIVKNVDVVTNPAGQEPGKYLAITFETEDGDQIAYVDLSDLISVYVSGNNGITVSNNQIGLKIDAANANGLSIGENGLQLAAVNSLTIVRKFIDTTSAIAENEVVTVDPYIVGQNKFQLFMLGVLCECGQDKSYLEVGTDNQTSTLIQILFPIPAGTRLEYIIYS